MGQHEKPVQGLYKRCARERRVLSSATRILLISFVRTTQRETGGRPRALTVEELNEREQPFLVNVSFESDLAWGMPDTGTVTAVEIARLWSLVNPSANKPLAMDATADASFQMRSRALFKLLERKDGDKVTFEEFAEYVRSQAQDTTISWTQRIYFFLSEPTYSIGAKITSLFILAAILLSTFALFFATSREFQKVPDCGYNVGYSGSDADCSEPEPKSEFAAIELCCIVIFTIEYGLRAICSVEVDVTLKRPGVQALYYPTWKPRPVDRCKNIWGFIKDRMNLIDLFSILPFYVEAFAASINIQLGFLRVLRLLRVFRIFKMGKYNKKISLFAKVLILSAPALSLLVVFGAIAVVLFGSIIYYCEMGTWERYCNGSECQMMYVRKDVTGLFKEPTPFTSIMQSFWWVLVTSTTVGYGDMYPTSAFGKVVGTMCMIMGILVLALPVTVFGSNFNNVFYEDLEKEKEKKRKRNMQVAGRTPILSRGDGDQKRAPDDSVAERALVVRRRARTLFYVIERWTKQGCFLKSDAYALKMELIRLEESVDEKKCKPNVTDWTSGIPCEGLLTVLTTLRRAEAYKNRLSTEMAARLRREFLILFCDTLGKPKLQSADEALLNRRLAEDKLKEVLAEPVPKSKMDMKNIRDEAEEQVNRTLSRIQRRGSLEMGELREIVRQGTNDTGSPQQSIPGQTPS